MSEVQAATVTDPVQADQVNAMIDARLAAERAATVQAVQEAMAKTLAQYLGPRGPSVVDKPADLWVKQGLDRHQRCDTCRGPLTIWTNAGARQTAATCTNAGCASYHEPVGNVLVDEPSAALVAA